MQKRCTEELSGGKKRKEPKKRRFGSTSIAELNHDISEPAWAALREGSISRRQQRGASNQIVVWVMRLRCGCGAHTNKKRLTHALEKTRAQRCCCCVVGGGGWGERLRPRSPQLGTCEYRRRVSSLQGSCALNAIQPPRWYRKSVHIYIQTTGVEKFPIPTTGTATGPLLPPSAGEGCPTLM